jgi:hypothetical protein
MPEASVRCRVKRLFMAMKVVVTENQGKDAECEEGQEHANSSSLVLYA